MGLLYSARFWLNYGNWVGCFLGDSGGFCLLIDVWPRVGMVNLGKWLRFYADFYGHVYMWVIGYLVNR
jgi:hypothetical protein